MSNDSEVLADWHYSPEEWSEYVETEKDVYHSEIPDFLKNSVYYVIAAVIVLLFIALLDWRAAAGMSVLLIVPGILLFAVGIHWLMRNNQVSIMSSRPGNVQITTGGVVTNGILFDWEFEGNRSRFFYAKKTTTYTANGELNLLEFKCLVKIKVKGTYQTFEKKWRVPIPFGKENEADIVIQRLYQAKAMFSESNSNCEFSAEPLGISAITNAEEHDFTASTVCLKCGSSIEAVTHFKWKCKK